MEVKKAPIIRADYEDNAGQRDADHTHYAPMIEQARIEERKKIAEYMQDFHDKQGAVMNEYHYHKMMQLLKQGKSLDCRQGERKMDWLKYCKSCGHNHLMTMKKCPTCNVYETPQPVSEKVYEKCQADYSCDGCIAYRTHTNPY